GLAVAYRVEQSGGFHPVVPAAQAVQVLDGGGTAASGVLEVELLDVVHLADRHDVAVAAGHGAHGIDEAQVLGNRGGGAIGAGGGVQVVARDGIGQHSLEGGCLGDQLARHAGRDRDGAVEGGGSVREPEQCQQRDHDREAEGWFGHFDRTGVELCADCDRVPQGGQRQVAPCAGGVPVEVEGDRRSGLERVTLRVLDGAGGGIEPLAEGGELGDRATDHEAGGAVAVRGGREGDRALLLRGLLDGPAAEPGHQRAQLAVEAPDVDRLELPGGDPLIDLPALVRGETQDA